MKSKDTAPAYGSDKIHDSEIVPKFKTFEEFYPFYLTQHSKPKTKLFHFIGTAGSQLIAAHFFATVLVFMSKWLTYPETEC